MALYNTRLLGNSEESISYCVELINNGEVIGIPTRITSYNVCYTKLLRNIYVKKQSFLNCSLNLWPDMIYYTNINDIWR